MKAWVDPVRNPGHRPFPNEAAVGIFMVTCAPAVPPSDPASRMRLRSCVPFMRSSCGPPPSLNYSQDILLPRRRAINGDEPSAYSRTRPNGASAVIGSPDARLLGFHRLPAGPRLRCDPCLAEEVSLCERTPTSACLIFQPADILGIEGIRPSDLMLLQITLSRQCLDSCANVPNK